MSDEELHNPWSQLERTCAELQAGQERLQALLRDCLSAVSADLLGIDYIEVQIDRRTLAAAQAALEGRDA